MQKFGFALAAAVAALAGSALADTIVAPMALATPTGPGASVGTVIISDAPGGVTFALDLHGLPAGAHGFHVHVNPSCVASDRPAGGAGPHLDPAKTNMHTGPEGMGHLGDLPVLVVGADQSAHQTLKAPRFTSVAQLKGHALVIHADGDNYSDMPTALGGGGARLACGVIG
jgi:Cu-Zn family superoxide dismutase